MTLSLLASTVLPAMSQSFIFDLAPFRECHAATIEESKSGLVAAWFAGDSEGARNVGIWISRQVGDSWSNPKEVARDPRHPCWNPVLFQPKAGPIMLFFKVGPNPRQWWGMLITSADGGLHWSKPKRLPNGILGPIKNRPIQFESGDILCPSSNESDGWQVHFERTSDLGLTWTKSPPANDGKAIEAIQPSLLRLGKSRLAAVGRTRQNRIFTIRSEDDGKTWGPMRLLDIPNPNSGTDAITLRDGRHLFVYNPTVVPVGKWTGDRSPLSIAISKDGALWTKVRDLETEKGQEFSYPSLIQARDGRIHIVYTWKRHRIRHVSLDPADIP